MKTPKTEKVNASELKINPNNPRLIKDEKFKKLVKSIEDFPEMIQLRPIVVDENNVILGGNMRYRAMIEAGLKEVYIIKAENLTEQQKKEFIIKDNVGFGEWDWDILANEWSVDELDQWGLNLPAINVNDYLDKNKEIDTDEFANTMTIKLNYSEEEYLIVTEQLSRIASTNEQAIWKLLGNE